MVLVVVFVTTWPLSSPFSKSFSLFSFFAAERYFYIYISSDQLNDMEIHIHSTLGSQSVLSYIYVFDQINDLICFLHSFCLYSRDGRGRSSNSLLIVFGFEFCSDLFLFLFLLGFFFFSRFFFSLPFLIRKRER
jgi:hypothetical protein